MRTILWTIGVIVIGAVLLVTVSRQNYIYRYRLVLDVMVDGTLHSGSAVYESRFNDYKTKMYADTSSEHRGEAMVVDLGDRGRLFAGLKMDPERIAPRRVGVSTTPRFEAISRDVYNCMIYRTPFVDIAKRSIACPSHI